jgi:hypothetical protein
LSNVSAGVIDLKYQDKNRNWARPAGGDCISVDDKLKAMEPIQQPLVLLAIEVAYRTGRTR